MSERKPGPAGRITAIRPTTVTVPLHAHIRHANGVHWGRFVRTLIEVETDQGLVGIGEMGGGGESAELAFRSLQPYLLGHDPFDLEALRWKLMNPTASLYNNRSQLHAAIEFACLDLMGQSLGMRVCDLLGGALREEVEFASYLFFTPEIETADEMAAHARQLAASHGFRAHKLKGGVFPPGHDVEVLHAVAAALPGDRVRLDPNAAWTVEESIDVARAIEDLPNDYLEDPTFGLEGMRRVRDRIRIPTATNTVVVGFEQLAASIRLDAVDVILLDTTFWGGLRQAVQAAKVCETFQVGVSVHSSGELGVQLATMLHLGAVLPNLRFAADAHYHHLVDDVIEGGALPYREGRIAVPTGPGLGVQLDPDRVGEYAELYRSLGGYPYDRDPQRPDWFAVSPGGTYASPRGERMADADHRQLGAELNGRAWALLEQQSRSADDDDRLLAAAYGSLFHWMEVAGATEQARGHWLIARAHTVLGNKDGALVHAQRCLDLTVEAGLTDFDLGYAHEGVARALALRGDHDAAAEHRSIAAATPIVGEEDRRIFEADLNADPWFGLP